MRKLIVQEWMSIDGYVADKEGQLDFFTNLTPEQNADSDSDQLKFLNTVDTILLGRKTYELFVDFWPNAGDTEVVAEKLNATPKVVFSKTLKEAPWGKWPDAQLQREDVVKVVRHLKSLPGRDMVLWGSISLAQALMRENLVDEYHLQISPVLLGSGRKFFVGRTTRQALNLLEIRQYDSGTVFLSYQPLKK